VSNAWVTALYVLGVDRPRILGAGSALLLRAACLAVAVLAGVAGGTAAAIAAVVGEVLLVAVFAVLVRRSYRRAGLAADVLEEAPR
jgi:predicted lysophospholipase L1 biosynthesis ABC-type transport system permease subunit